MSNEQDAKKALLENATDLARDAQRRLYPRERGGYQGPPSHSSHTDSMYDRARRR